MQNHFSIIEIIPDEMILNLLCCAFEGGSNYWIEEIFASPDNPINKIDFMAGGAQQRFDDYWHWTQIMPLTENCSIVITTRIGDGDIVTEYILGRDQILFGLQKMQDNFPRHWLSFLGKNEDATVADVFLQCCLFGDVLFT